jgi:signal transduction histidine kinase
MRDGGMRDALGLVRTILADLDAERVLERVLEVARERTGATYAALGVLDDRRQGLARFVTAGLDEPTRRRIGHLPKGRGVLGELIEHPEPLRLSDVGSHPRSYGFPSGHPPMTTFLGVPVLVAGEPYGNLYLTDKAGGGDFTDEDEEALLLLADLAGLAIGHASSYTGSETRRRDLERTVEALDVTVQIARALGGETDFRVVVDLIAKRARALVAARALVIEHEAGDGLEIVAAAGHVPDELAGRRVDRGFSVAARAMRSLRPHRLEAGDLQRLRGDGHPLSGLPFAPEAGLAVPMVFRGRSFGVLLAFDRMEGGPAFSTQDERLLESFGTSAAAAVATARTVAEDRRSHWVAATEHERARWARELHDETLQGLASLRLGLAGARRAGDARSLAAAAERAIAQLDEDIASLRALITDLRPAALDAVGTGAAIESLAERARGRGLEVDLHVDLAYEQGRAGERHAPELEVGMYRIVQEAINNVLAHGGARRARVEVVEEADALRLEIADDGAGFDPAAATTGFGLVGMRERAELLEGALDIESAPGRGTVVRATLPVRRREAAAA